MRTSFAIADRPIGPGFRCFFIAEAGVNHDGDLPRALALVDVAAEAGADAVKFQTFDADRLATRDAPKAAYQIEDEREHESQYEMLARLQLSADDHRAIMRHSEKRGILFLSTPFDEESANLLQELGVQAFKTPSGELTNLAYLAHIARFGKPMIMSTGMATLGQVESAVDAVADAGGKQLAILHCVSNYPAAVDDVNLRAMETLANAFRVPVGYSDHTLGLEIALAAVALGACVIEKHYTLDRAAAGPDHRSSLEPAELGALVAGIRAVEAALGDGRKVPASRESSTADVARKSLVAARNIEAGEVLCADDVVVKRPGTGLSPVLRAQIVGRRARISIAAGALLGWEMLA